MSDRAVYVAASAIMLVVILFGVITGGVDAFSTIP